MQIPYVLRAASALLLAGFSFTAATVAQTTYTWDGSADGNWSNTANWTGNAVPVDPASAPDNIVRFDSNSSTIANLLTTMNMTSGLDLSKIVITDPAATVTIRAATNENKTIDLIPVGVNGTTIDMSAASQDLTFALSASSNRVLILNVSGTNASQTWNVAAGRTLTTIDVDGSTSNILTLTGGGTIAFNGTTDNGSLRVTVTGNTLATLGKTSTAAVHALGGGATSVIDNGSTMRITGTGGDQIFFQHDLQVDGVLDLNGNSEGFDGLLSGSGITTGVITSGAAGNVTLRINESSPLTTTVYNFGGVIQDGAGVVSLLKAHVGIQVFAGNSTYSGSTTVSRGILQLLGANGALSNTSGIILDGMGELRLDNRTASGGFAAAVNNDRIADDATVDMRGGILSVYGVSTTDVSETIGGLNITSGFNVVRLSSDATGNTATGLTLASLSRNTGATLGVMVDALQAATNFGVETFGVDTDWAYLRVASGGIEASMLSGASGTGVERDILIGVFGSGSTTTSNASDFMTMEVGGDEYDYLRPLFASEYATVTSGEIGQKNALSTANTTLNLSTAYNALKISAGAVNIGANKTLYLGGHAGSGSEGSGMLLITGGTGITGGLSSLATLDFGSREAIIRVTGGTGNIDAHITGSNGLTKSGTSALILNNSNSFTGAVYVTEGTLQIKNDKALGAAGGNVYVGVGGTATNSSFQLANGVNVTGENVILGTSNASQSVGFASAGGHNTWGGDVIASNTGLGGRADSESLIQSTATDSALTIYGRVYAAQGAAQTDLTYYGNDGNFTRRINFSGSGAATINLYGTLSDTATGVASSAVDRLRVNMSGNSELNVNIRNQVEVTGIMHLIQGYMRYEGTGNFFHASTSTSDRMVLFDPGTSTNSQVAFLLTKAGQSFSRRTSAAGPDIQIGNAGTTTGGTTGSNVLIGGENESGVVTYGTGVQHMEFNPMTSSTDVGRFRDLRVYARQGGEVEFKMSMSDDTGFGLANEIGALTKVGLGTVRLTGRNMVNNDLDGGAYLLGGTLLLDYNTVNNTKIHNLDGAQFTTAGGDLRLIKGNAGTITELMSGSLAVRTGGSEISIDAGLATSIVNLKLATNTGATITRQNGGTLNFVKSGLGTASIKVGLAAIQNTRLGSYATFGTENNKATSWAFVGAANEITSYTHNSGTELNAFGAGLNTDLTLDATLGAATTTNSIRINDTAVSTIALGGNQLTITEGGILVGAGHTGALSITNGTITTGNTNDLIIHNYGTGGLTISADIVGATQSVTYAGKGVTTLSGAKSYTGTTYLVGGTVSIADNLSLGNAANTVYFNGGELQTTASVTTARAITIGGDGAYIETVGSGNVTTLSGLIASEGNFIYNETNASTGAVVNPANDDSVGVGDLIKTGAGTLTITNGANVDWAGVMDVREGTLKIDIADVASGTAFQRNMGTNESWLDATIVRNGATLALNKVGTANIAAIGEWFRMEDNTKIVVTGGRFGTSGLMEVQGALTIEVNGGTSTQFDQQGNGGYMFGNGNITKTGGGTWFLLGNNNLFTGSITVLEGLFGARGQGQITGSDFNEVITIGGTGTAAEFRRISSNEFVNNYLVENHNIVVTGSGDKRIGYGNNSIPNGDDFVDFNGTITLNTNTTLNVDVTNSGSGTPKSQTAYLRFNGALLGSGNVTTRVSGGGGAFTRTGVYELNADNTAWTGSLTVGNDTLNAVNLHVVRFGSNDALKSDNAVILKHNSTLQAGGHTVTAGNFSTLAAATTDVVENAAHADGTIAFTQTTNGDWDATFRDGTPIGTVYEQDGNATVGKLNIVKEGNAVATLTLNNLYTGGTTVNAGTLQVGRGGLDTNRAVGDTGTGSTTSVLTVNAGGRVAGTGTVQGVAGTTTHFVTGTISPGDIVSGTSTTGTLDVVGNLNVSGGTIQLQAANYTANDFDLSVYEAGTAEYSQRITAGISDWESSATGTTRGDHDLLNINGQLTLDSNSTVNLEFVSFLANAGDIFDLIDWVGALGGSFDVGANFRNGGNGGGDLYLPTLASGLVYDLSLFNSNGIIIVANAGVVPEPGRALLLMLGATSLVLRRRRRTVR